MLTPRLLPGDCLINYRNAWLTRDAKQIIAVCDSNKLGTLPIDGSAATTVTTFSTVAPLSIAMDQTSVIYLDGQHLMRVPATGGSAAITLAIDARGVPAPTLAPDGARVVYVADGATGMSRLLLSVPIEGGTPATLFTNTVGITLFTLSPDGSRVFTLSPTFTLLSIPVAGGSAVDLGDGPVGNVAFSPNGQKLAFVTRKPPSTPAQYQLAIGDLDNPPTVFGGSFETGGGGANQLVFTPAGDRIIVDWTGAQLPQPNRFIDSVPAAGGNAAPIAKADKLRLTGLVGRNGDAVLFEAQIGAASPELSIVDAAGGTPIKLSTLDKCIFNSAQRELVVLSPDRTRAVYADALDDLVLADLDARTTMILVPTATTPSNVCGGFLPVWSPDGGKIAYNHCPASGSCDIRVVTTTGVALTTVGAASLGGAYFSPDSKHIVGRDSTTGNVFTFGNSGVTTAAFRARIPLTMGSGPPIATGFIPTGFPWIDATHFVVETGIAPMVGTGVIDIEN